MLRTITSVKILRALNIIRPKLLYLSTQLPPDQTGSSNQPGPTEGGGEGVFNTPSDVSEPPLPPYTPRLGEELGLKKARVMYQSRKRGMLENDLLLSSFTHRYLPDMTDSQVDQLDIIINKPSNDWDIYDWITGKKQVPTEYDNEVMKMLKEHVKNTEYEDRTRMPDLKS